MKAKALIIATIMTVLLEVGSVTAYAKEQYNVNRIGGATRIETSAKIADNYNDSLVSTVVVTTANDFREALVGSTLAAKNNAPILLVYPEANNSSATLNYIKGHLKQGGKVYILGNTNSVSLEIENNIRRMGYSNIERLQGNNEDATLKAINDEVNVMKGTSVFIASEDNFPDALSASGIAAIKGYPIILCSHGQLSDAAISSLKSIKPKQLFVLGGPAVLPETVVAEAKAITGANQTTRLYGPDRYDTSLAIDRYFDLGATKAVVASGENFPDALAGSSLAAKNKAPIILVNTEVSRQKQYLDNTQISDLTVLGGTGVITQKTVDNLTGKSGIPTTPVSNNPNSPSVPGTSNDPRSHQAGQNGGMTHHDGSSGLSN